MLDLKNTHTEELEELLIDIQDELDRRRKKKTFCLKTEAINPKKHGQAYLARISVNECKDIIRDFIDHNGKNWTNIKNTYETSFTFTAKEGDVFEGRLSSSSWKKDSKSWFKVVKDNEGKLFLKKFTSLNEVLDI